VNDSPGWTSPGSSPSEGSPGSGQSSQTPGSAPQGRPADGPPKNWSAQQPPAYGGAGWGGPPAPPGWGKAGGAWSHQPPAAKPGVIPLRPLGVGEILDGAVTTMRAHWRTVLSISLVVAVVVQLVGTLVTGFWLRDATDLTALSKNPEPSPEQLMGAMSSALSSSGVAVLVDTLGTVIATAMLMIVVSRAVLGRTVDVGEAWRDSRPQLLRLLGLLVLVPLLVSLTLVAGAAPGLVALAAGLEALGVVLMVLGLVGGLVGAIWLWVRFSLAAPALMLEKQGVLTAMRRSAKLVRGSWWRVFGVQILAAILVFIVASIIQMPATLVGALVSGEGISTLTDPAAGTSWPSLVSTGIGAVIASTITFPIRAGVTALIYLDQRIRSEALDLELARAAGISGYGEQQADRPAAGG
jgi:hypothetical protein